VFYYEKSSFDVYVHGFFQSSDLTFSAGVVDPEIPYCKPRCSDRAYTELSFVKSVLRGRVLSIMSIKFSASHSLRCGRPKPIFAPSLVRKIVIRLPMPWLAPLTRAVGFPALFYLLFLLVNPTLVKSAYR